MPKLLQLDSCLNVGSTGRIAEAIGLLAMARGWECYIAHGARYVGKSAMHSYQVTTKTDEYLHYAKSLFFDAHGLGSGKDTKALVDWIKNVGPDVIQLHGIHGYWLNYRVLFEYLAETNIPMVWTFHDCWEYTGHCSHYSSSNCVKWRERCHDCPKMKSYPKALIDKSRRNFDLKKHLFTSVKNLTIVPVSYWLGSEVRQSFMKNYPIHVIQNGIDLKTFYPRKEVDSKIREKYGLGNHFVILSVATKWHQDNGYYDFMKLRPMLDEKYLIVLVGVSEIQKKELPKGIVGISRTDSKDELAELYTVADIAVTTQTEATFGLVTVEAMACGTPVIVYNSTACPEVVAPGTGFVIPPKDIDALSKTIVDYSTNHCKEEYTMLCVQQASNFDENKKYEEYVNLYESLIANQL